MQLTTACAWLRKGWNAIDLASQLLLLLVLLIRLAGLHEEHVRLYISLAAACAVLMWSKMLFFMMPFSTTGAHPSACSCLCAACHAWILCALALCLLASADLVMQGHSFA